jgi:HAD superfamily hydrolase (TIGR01490 family)
MVCGGISVETMNALAKEFTGTVLVRYLYREALERLMWHKEAKHTIVLLSASPDLYLSVLARTLEVDSLICTRLRHEGGVVTGDLAGKNCKANEKLMRLLAEYRSRHIDWNHSFAYADSVSDLPILERVGNAVVVNPDSRLRFEAVRRGWKVESWKK